MSRILATVILVIPVLGCEQTELSTAAAINAAEQAYMQDLVRLEGRRVKRNNNTFFLSTSRFDYLVLEDGSGRIRVWYDVTRQRCPPRLNAQLTVEGKVVATGPEQRHIFAAKSISIDDEPPLAKHEVRMCQLSLREQQIYAEYGSNGLLQYWSDKGTPERVLVYD